MGVEFSSQCNECESIIRSNCHKSMEKKSKQTEIENRIEYQLKAYLAAKDSGYNTLISPNYKPSKSDSKLIRKLIYKSPECQRFSFNLIHQIFAERFSLHHTKTDQQSINRATIEFCGESPLKNNAKTLIQRPKTRKELIACIQSAISTKCSINIPNGSHISAHDDLDTIHIDLSGLNAASMQIDDGILSKFGKSMHDNSNLILCESGSSPKRIHSVLWPKSARNALCDENGTEYKVLPIVYDYKLNSKTMHEIISNCNNQFVQSIQMVIIEETYINNIKTRRSRVVQIEPSRQSGAIHDSMKWKAKYPHIELIQNDKLFALCLNEKGLVGVVYSYHLRVENAFFCQLVQYNIAWSDFKQKLYLELMKEHKARKIIAMQLKISPYTTFNKKYSKSPPIALILYKKTMDAKTDGHCSVDLDENGVRTLGAASTLSVFVWVRRVFPELIPFLIEMQMEYDHNCSDEDGGDRQLQYVENVESELDADEFMGVIDEYIDLCNDLKRASNGRQYLLSPLVVRFGDGCVCVKQRICKLKRRQNGKSNEMLKEIQAVFAPRHKGFEYDNTAAQEGYFDRARNIELKQFCMKQYSSDLILDKLIKSNSAHDQAQPLSV